MNLLKKPFSISLQALAGVLIFSCLLAHPFSEAASSPPGDKRDYMLVLNTYTESAPWSSHIINSIVAHIDQVDNFKVYTENMNSLLMTFKKHKTGEIESFKNNLLREYGKNPPRMLVLLGAPIAVLRDFVKQTWPGVPLILCSEMDYIGPENAYLDRRPLRPEERLPLCDKAVSDNITLIRTPLYLRENVELMRRMIPGMDSLIFVGDGRYINQQADSDLRELLDREFPQIDYRFYSAHEMSTEALLDSLNRIDIHRTGILFSSWHYTKKIGDNIVSVTDSYRVIASVQAPMFALMPADIRDGGLVGGYVYDAAEVNAHVISTIDAVLAGHQPRDIPFYTPQDARPVFNYAALERKDLSPHTCPANTLFYNKPVSTLEQYKWAIGGIVLLLLAFIGIQQWRIRMMYRVESARQRESESLAKYSNLFNAMPIVYIQMKVIYDENGNPADALYCDVNSRYERIFIPREQAIGRRVSELFPFPMTEFMRLIKIAQTENRTITYPYYYEPRDIFYEVVISRSYLEEHIDIFCLDGTALYKTQQKLDSINHKLAMALDVADIVPWKWDLRKGSILCDVNKSVHGQMLAGTNADQQLEVPSESYFAKIHKEDRERVRRAYDDLIAGRKDKVREEYRVASDAGGRWHLDWVEAQATVDQRDDDGRPLNLIGSSLVITPRKRLEQDLRSARDRAEESNRLKSAFLANMSHEIRTPLNAIVGFSSILAETDEEQEKREYISIIENNNALLLQLIGDILDLSKIEAGTLEFNFSDFELNELMHEKENIIRMKTAEGVELIFEPGLDACLFHSDRNRLSQLLINLLTNAAKFTAKGSIRFGYRTEGNRLRFYVSDTGCGIPPEGQRRIFDRFVKLNSFKQGTGLGLPICKSIVEHLGGEIGVKSEEGRGTTFWFTLPYVTGKPCETPCGEIPTVSVEKDKLTILIAEDNDSNYRLFETILRRDYRLIHARDGEQAVELCRTEHPHLILMDINMPVMNGYEAAAEIRKFAAEIPIVAVTAYAYASDEQKIMQNGFTGYMPKPINAPQLKKQILDILRERITLI
ncbi:ATP-binding protein [Alistipes shahii]|uniref:ATP-binding protein n=1 Tax=Alistipes shahii TaxID=328814 RepID=UPI0036F3CED1